MAATDHANLEESLPVAIKNVFPIAYRGWEVQELVRYDNTDNDPKDAYLFALKPRLDFGSFRNLQGQTRSDLRH